MKIFGSILVGVAAVAAVALIWQRLLNEGTATVASSQPAEALQANISPPSPDLAGRPAARTREDSRQPPRSTASMSFPQRLRAFGTASSEDLVALYREGVADSATLPERYLAKQVIDFCEPIARSMPMPPFTDTNDRYVEVVRAQQLWRERCAGMSRQVRLDDLLRNKQKLNSALDSQGSPFARDALEAPRGEGSLRIRVTARRVFEEHGEAAMGWAFGAVLAAIEDGMNEPERRAALSAELSRRPDLVTSSIVLAQCALAIACTGDSLQYVSLCSQSGICGGSVEAGVLGHHSSQADRDAVLMQAKAIVAAVKARRFGLLGLGD